MADRSSNNPVLSLPFRFALVRVIGKRAASDEDTFQRVNTLLDIATRIHRARWKDLEAVILPRGFFYLGEPISSYGYKKQRTIISRSLFHPFVEEALEILARWSPDVVIIAGVDTAPALSGMANQPMHTAWNGCFVMSIHIGDYKKPKHYNWLGTIPVTLSSTGEAFFIQLCEAAL